MDHVALGRTALQVSRLCLGTLNLGVRTTVEDAQALLDLALEHRINFVDTADMYGWQVHRGFTEELLGQWFARGSARRDKVVLATKVGQPMSDWPGDTGLSARHIITACEASLRRLRTDRIDLLQMHYLDPAVRWDEVWQAMDALVAQGKVCYVGTSNFAGWQLVSAHEAARRHGRLGIVSEQCVYNLVRRHVELELVPAAVAYGIGVVAWSPLHGGLLSGALRKLDDGTAVKSAQGRAQAALPGLHDAVAEFEKLCAELGRPPAEVALAWVLGRPGLTAAAIGPRTREHLLGAVRAAAAPLPGDVLARLDTLFPPIAPGSAPDAWLT